jgi:hypothetical protein
VEKERRCDVEHNDKNWQGDPAALFKSFTPEQYTLIQQMIDASIQADLGDETLATEEYVDDAIRGVENSMADHSDVRSVENDLESLEDRVSDLEREG